MNWRYIYIGSVVVLSYVLFLSWNAEKEIKQEFAEASFIEQNKSEELLPSGETVGFVQIQNEKLDVLVSPSSGKIWQARLKEHTYLNNKESQGVRVFGFDPLSGFKFYLNSGFVSEGDGFDVVEVTPSSISLVSLDGKISKSISLKEGDYELMIKDSWVGEVPADVPTPYVAMYRTDGRALDARDNFFENSSYTGVAFNTPDEPYANTRLRSIDERVEYFQRGGWVAFIQKYFMAAIITPSDRVQTLIALPPSSGSDTYVMGAISRETKVNEIISGVEHKIFLGPKVRSDLISRAPDLELTIDMGWFWFLAQPLMMLLSMINALVGNWGVSIILLTFLIKLLLWPVSAKGFSSMAKMRTAGPKLKEIQERYKDDRAKLGTEMMALYKKEGINPAGGCFPLLLQMPVFIAFFFCLRESVELRHESFFFWIQDLSAPDPFFILPVMFAGLMYLTQQLNPQPPGMDPTQAQIMKFMPVMIAAIFIIMPAGLVLYSVANSAISLVQQRAMYKKYGASDFFWARCWWLGEYFLIFALATPIAQSAIGVFRVSGAGCCDVFNKALNKPITKYREVFLRDVFRDGVLIDRCSIVFYSGPHSYTGEDSVEVFCHGGLSVIKSLTGVFLALGFKEAGPGEFSKIAFENGKLSLNEAEAVADLIHSEDIDRSLLSSEAVAGKLSSIILELGNEVDELRVFVEGSIDFSDEDYDFILEGDVEKRLLKIRSSLVDLIDSSLISTKKLSKNRVLFFGPPNTGKSSLFNRLLGFERALVSSLPGTTRDLIDSEMFYNSVNMELVDSAGIRDTGDSIEADGVALSSKEIEDSALVLVVLDHSTEAYVESFKSMVSEKNHLMVFNKSDEKNPAEKYDCVVSAKSGKGVQKLKKMIFDSIQQNKNTSKKTFIIRERHLVLFNTALSSLDACIEKISNEKDVDVAAEDLRLVRSSFDEFLGIKYPDDLLGDIFNDFCIGK